MLKKLTLWVRQKFGRIVTFFGGAVALADMDVSPIKQQLEEMIGHKWVTAIVVVLFVISFLRHHQAAKKT